MHGEIRNLIREIPFFVKLLAVLLVILALAGIVASFGVAIYRNRKKWKPRDKSDLMYSWFCGSGIFRKNSIYTETFKLLYDYKWFRLSAACTAHDLGQFKTSSNLAKFFMSIAYIPLALMGGIELVIRRVAGTLIVWILFLLHTLLLMVLKILSTIVIPLYRGIDWNTCAEQHCPDCYNTFRIPVFECKKCGVKHHDLFPDSSGLLFARCKCEQFLPAMSLTGRSKLSSYCPKCGRMLVSANTRQFSIQLVGGNQTGKTAYLAAFAYKLFEKKPGNDKVELFGEPHDSFLELESAYLSGVTHPSSPTEVGTYTFQKENSGNMIQNSLVIYDIPDESILQHNYEKNPINFGYSDGILIIIDPVSQPEVRDECVKNGDADALDQASEDQTEALLIEFINQFTHVAGKKTGSILKQNVAVVINKSDIKAVHKNIGMPKIRAVFKKDPAKYNNDIGNAENELCRNYLISIGLANAVNNIESVFRTVRYFSVSSMGHPRGSRFEPRNVIAPMLWLSERGRCSFVTEIRQCMAGTEKEGVK